MTVPDWAAWSAEAVAIMKARNRAWVERFGLAGRPYHWDLDTATLRFDGPSGQIVADICAICTTSAAEGTFLWAWANEAVPVRARRHLDQVRAFGDDHDLPLLTTPEWPGGEAEGLEMLAVAGRILDADGVWVDRCGDVTMYFALSGIRHTGRAIAPIQRNEHGSELDV